MDRKYTILAILAVIMAAGLLIIPDRSKTREVEPEKLLTAITNDARFLSTDLVTERIIEGDPALLLIDVRSPEQFSAYALKGAVNIPLDSLLSPASVELLLQPGKDKIFYSNGDTDAEAAWLICTRGGYTDIYVMKGGLNEWYNTIIKGVEPQNTASSAELDLHNFRQSAKLFFTGGNSGNSERPVSKEAKSPEKVKIERKPAEQSGGGC